MMKKIRMIHWLVVLLVLGLAAGLFVSCGDDDNGVTEPEPTPNDIEVELQWAEAVNMDLYLDEPTGPTAGLGNDGTTGDSNGDNRCGFGSACDASTCVGLTCDTRETIYVASAASGTYTVFVANNVADDLNVIVFMTLPQDRVAIGQAYFHRFECTVPASSVEPIAEVSGFPASPAMEGIAGTGNATCDITDSLFR